MMDTAQDSSKESVNNASSSSTITTTTTITPESESESESIPTTDHHHHHHSPSPSLESVLPNKKSGVLCLRMDTSPPSAAAAAASSSSSSSDIVDQQKKFALSLLTTEQEQALVLAGEKLKESSLVAAQHSYDSCIAAGIEESLAQAQAQEVFDQRMTQGQSQIQSLLEEQMLQQLQALQETKKVQLIEAENDTGEKILVPQLNPTPPETITVTTAEAPKKQAEKKPVNTPNPSYTALGFLCDIVLAQEDSTKPSKKSKKSKVSSTTSGNLETINKKSEKKKSANEEEEPSKKKPRKPTTTSKISLGSIIDIEYQKTWYDAVVIASNPIIPHMYSIQYNDRSIEETLLYPDFKGKTPDGSETFGWRFHINNTANNSLSDQDQSSSSLQASNFAAVSLSLLKSHKSP